MRGEQAFLFDMLESCDLVTQFVAGKTCEQFMADAMLREAVLRRLGIIGEAARLVSPATRAKLPDVPWEQIVGMRNVLVHVYFAVKLTTVWDTATRAMSRHWRRRSAGFWGMQ